jgi:ribonuclease G
LRRDLVISAGPGDWRAALVEDGAAVELYVERGDTRPAGSIVLGRVVHRAAGLDSAFVAIGDARPGIVPLREAAADGVTLDEGARVIVEVRREALPGKGARLSTRLAPGLDHAGLAAAAATLDPPALLHPAVGFAAALSLRLPGLPESVFADDVAAIPDLRAALPAADCRVLDPDAWPLDIDGAIDAALASKVELEGGAALRIDETEAAVLIDVDSGTPDRGPAARTTLAANLAAAAAIARQIRLRNLGGGIVVDFVGLEGRGLRERVRQALTDALASDPALPQILGWTRLGHLEIVRPRRGRSLASAMLEPDGAPARQAIAAADEALRALWRQARATPGTVWAIAASPALAAVLGNAAAAGLRTLETRLGFPVKVATAEALGARGFDIVPRRTISGR